MVGGKPSFELFDTFPRQLKEPTVPRGGDTTHDDSLRALLPTSPLDGCISSALRSNFCLPLLQSKVCAPRGGALPVSQGC